MNRLADTQMTAAEAVAFAQGGWQELQPIERGVMQLRQGLPCMPFSAAHQGVEALLGRPVFPHEFANPDALWTECEGKVPAPELEAIVAALAPTA